MLIINIRSKLSLIVINFLFLPKDYLIYIILVVYLKTNLLKKFNLNLDYILIKTLDFDNQNNTLFKIFYQKFINIF